MNLHKCLAENIFNPKVIYWQVLHKSQIIKQMRLIAYLRTQQNREIKMKDIGQYY